ncbi:MAG: sugar ABC transporter permease [Candidatus Faecousia sp.]|nr:sugar ABC transporter permease [Clostridiales bacterium]MDD6297174.1 sugar ABC transporter permease [Bacillota bacterium]MDD7341446.1 sugar ABC transporter permease [Bacillota bacterium]MDY2809627.1 sugar ABC transporter permease [Candidatus Faecousia sp.]
MQGKRKKELKQSLTAASFLAPSLLGLILFSAVPVVFSMFISLTDWNYVNGIGNWNFVWFENFKKLWSDEWFRASLCNTFVYTVVTVPIGLFLAVVIAALIDQFCAKKLAGMLRVTMYMPKICNIVASAAVWTMLYSTYGPFTQLMKALGWTDPPRFLASYTWALPAVMLMSIWQGLGYHVFLYSASLTSLPKDIYEAADLDGVNGIQRFFYITLPQLKPTTFFLTVTGIISSFKVFGQINVMTHGGPGSSTYTLVYYIYKSAFTYYEMGYASAVAMVLFAILLCVTLYQWHHNKNND